MANLYKHSQIKVSSRKIKDLKNLNMSANGLRKIGNSIFQVEPSFDISYLWKVSKIIEEVDSEFQNIKILKVPNFGKMMTIDDAVMITDKNEFIYHEMIVHPAVNAIKPMKRKALNVLVIGAGDGGTVRELTKYSDKIIKSITVVEIDKQVVKLARKHFPKISKAMLEDNRVDLIIDDGFKYINSGNEEDEFFDIIINDSCDPFPEGPSEKLFTKDFYISARSSLSPISCFVTQTQSVWYKDKICYRVKKDIDNYFDESYLYTAPVPIYPYGNWSFVIAFNFGYDMMIRDKYKEVKNFINYKEIKDQVEYYNSTIHKLCFHTPNFILKELREKDIKCQNLKKNTQEVL